MRSWSSYRALWPVFGVLALILWVLAALRPGTYQLLGAVLLTAVTIVAYLRGRSEAPTT